MINNNNAEEVREMGLHMQMNEGLLWNSKRPWA